ncbi:S8 family serine peptidase [Kribbella qitaiheensis]|uniref:S8 family serine peptidase n=1 Tax=Kribbella qitaiheensis TaxID=1544730 RepID=UPI0036124D81
MIEQFDPHLKQHLLERTGLLPEDGPSAGPLFEEDVPVLVRLALPDAEVPGLRVVARFGSIVTGRLPLGRIPETRRYPAVASLKASRPVRPPLEEVTTRGGATDDSPYVEANAPSAGGAFSNSTVPSDEPFTGAGVLVGACDWGLDVAHAAFRHADGTTRLRALWDQRPGPCPASPAQYGYGRLITQDEINRALESADPYAALGYDPADADGDGQGTHGTHVLDIAAGSGRATESRAGAARGADLAFVHLGAGDIPPEETLGDSVRLLEAVHWLVDLAGSDPVVVNLSAGSTGGPHDRSPLAVQALDALMANHAGVAVILSCGNYAQSRLHAAGAVPADRNVDLPWIVQRHGNRPAEVEIWYPGSAELSVALVDPGGRVVLTAGLGEDRVVHTRAGIEVSAFHRRHDPNNGDNVANLFLWPPALTGTWTIRLVPVNGRVEPVHAYVERTDVGAQSWLADATPASVMAVDPSGTTGTICNGITTLAVGALDARLRPARPAPFSSYGPTRDGRAKPDLVAPGVGIRAARSSPRDTVGSRPSRPRLKDQLAGKSGTSMAAPAITGCVALMYEAALPARITAPMLRTALLAAAIRPAGLPAEEIARVGAGTPDPMRACAAVLTLIAGSDAREQEGPSGVTPLTAIARLISEAAMTVPTLGQPVSTDAFGLPEQVWPAYPAAPYWGESGPAAAVPIVIVPGIMGSRLVEPYSPWAPVWDPMTVPPAVDFLRLVQVDRPLATGSGLDAVTWLRLSSAEVDRARQVTNLGSLIFWFYGRLALALSGPTFGQQLERRTGLPPRVYGAGYDWRQSCRRSALTLREIVTRALAECRARQVILVAHSMGGIVSRWFCKNLMVNDRPGSESVAALVLIGSPTHGAPEAYRWLKFGIDPHRDYPWAGLLDTPAGSGLAAAMRALPFVSRQLVRPFTSVFELLPTLAFGQANPSWITSDGVPAGGDTDRLYADPTLGLGSDASEAMATQLRARQSLHDGGHQRIGDYLPDPTFVLSGTGVPTDGGYELSGSLLRAITDLVGPTLQRVLSVSGDGTVPAFSGNATGLSLGGGGRQTVTGVSHRNLCDDPAIIAKVQEIVTQVASRARVPV